MLLSLRGDCGHGWSFADGARTYQLCGTGSGWTVQLAGTPWLGEGVLGGERIEVTFASSATSSLERSLVGGMESSIGLGLDTGNAAGATAGRQ